MAFDPVQGCRAFSSAFGAAGELNIEGAAPVSLSDRVGRILIEGTAKRQSPRSLLLRCIEELSSRFQLSGTLLYAYDSWGRWREPAGSLAADFRTPPPWSSDDPSQDGPGGVSGILVRATDLISRKRFESSAAYREYYGGLNVEHIACLRIKGRRHAQASSCGLMMGWGPGGGLGRDGEDALLSCLPALQALRHLDEQHVQQRTWALGIGADQRAALLVFSGAGELIRQSRAARDLFSGCCRLDLVRFFDRVERRLRDGWDDTARYIELACPFPHFSLRLTAIYDEGGQLAYMGTFHSVLDAEAYVAKQHALTPTEAAVLGCLGEGMSNAQIASFLGVAVSTTNTHVKSILAKLGVESRLQAGLLMQKARLLADAESGFQDI